VPPQPLGTLLEGGTRCEPQPGHVRDGDLATAGVLVDTEADGHRVAFNEAFKQKGVQPA